MTICNEICDDSMLKEVVIMEDNPSIRETIKKTLEENNWQVTIVENQDEAVKAAEEKRAAFFILDSEIENEKHEGIDALEKIKDIDKEAFVVILSCHPDRERDALKLKGRFYFKTKDIRKDTRKIAVEMLKYRKKILEQLQQAIIQEKKEIDKQIQKITNLESYFFDTSQSSSQDPNVAAYESLKSNPDWLAKHQGEYVAFVQGEFTFSCADRKQFFDKLTQSPAYKNQEVFYMKLEKQQRTIELLPSMELLFNEE